MDIKEHAWRIIEKFYEAGYITSIEEITMYGALNTASGYDNYISIRTIVDGRELVFVCCKYTKHFISFDKDTDGISAYINVFTPQREVDFTVNYNFENNKFWVDE